MPVSEHPIAITFNAPDWSMTLNGFDVGELTDRAVAYLMPRLPAPHTLKVRIVTQQPMAEERIRQAIENAVREGRRSLGSRPTLTTPAPSSARTSSMPSKSLIERDIP
ncbi:hypothetical protein FV222_00210 [Methylobacterium sp. WL103]|uniref:hypothetical protein n=1 Tax=Methylobacterium sp. WL103 TaxID=2603891 RepID=UPI0011CBC905|nr:hypothetical protein [Methylobacterium sp. WL103]TXN08929.1 hypothetical protein FV222_00210 [Methylobacterium sp. WL103]